MSLDLHLVAEDPTEQPDELAAREGLCHICGQPSDSAECDLCFDEMDRRWSR